MLVITPLRKQDRTHFDCGQVELNHYIQRLASQHVKHNMSSVFVACLDSKPDTVVGFYTLSQAQIDFEQISELLPKHYPRHYPVPLTRLGRFAVDKTMQGNGIGKKLLINALYRCYETSKQVGMTGVIVDAKDENAQRFYIKHDFTPLPKQPLTLVIHIKRLNLLFNSN